MRRVAGQAIVLAAAGLLLASCVPSAADRGREGPTGVGDSSARSSDASGAGPPDPGTVRGAGRVGRRRAGRAGPPRAGPARPPSDPWPADPAIRLAVDDLRVVPYRGTADDRPGTRIQDRGHAATPRGPRGGVGPGQVGNFVVTGHRTTDGRPFGELPALRRGDHVLVTAGGRGLRLPDHPDAAGLVPRPGVARLSQSAPVPGRPGVAATDAWITLSTCATPEDHAAGNYWFDALGNPEHRIDKVGRLVDVRPR